MAKIKKLSANLTLQGDETYSCNVDKTYTDSFVLEQELSDTDAFIKLSGFSKAIGSLSVANAKAIVVKNISNIAAELMIETYDWRSDSHSTPELQDIQNSIDINAEAAGGGATALRHISVLIPAGDFFYLNTNRLLTYALLDKDTLESAAKAPIGVVEIEPKSINSGNEYKGVQAIDGSDYGEGTEILNNGALSSTTDTSLVVDDGSWFKADDTIFFGTEVARVRSVSSDTLTIERALFGSVAIALSNDEPMNYFFGNHYLPFDTGKCQSDASGRFKQAGAFFGYARTDDTFVDGLVAGSVAILLGYTEGGFLDWGLSGITANGKTGLAASTAYTFHIVVDEFNVGGFDSVSSETAIAFTTDASDLTWAGSSNAVLPKIQAIFDEQFTTTSSGLLGKKVTIGIHNGDIRVTSHSNHSDTIVGIGNVSGTSPFGVGAFPALASSVPDLLGQIVGGGTTDTIVYGPASSLPPETSINPVTGSTDINSDVFLLDDGNGNLLFRGSVVGKISYTTGHCSWHVASIANAEFKIWGQSHSAHSGGSSTQLAGANSIVGIYARSVNPVENSKVKMVLFG